MNSIHLSAVDACILVGENSKRISNNEQQNNECRSEAYVLLAAFAIRRSRFKIRYSFVYPPVVTVLLLEHT
ncbi:MAG: hypothetical protein AAGI49_04095 [Bacteroidota bacterium]